nr:hypothetical protein [Legionella sp.]
NLRSPMTDALSYALYFAFGKTSGPKATRDYRPRSSTFLGLQRKYDLIFIFSPRELDAIEETDDEADQVLVKDTKLCTTSEQSFWKKPPNSLPGIRVAKEFKDSEQSVRLFRALDIKNYSISQHRSPDDQTVDLKVQLPTIKSP